jgi:hypothetical protein
MTNTKTTDLDAAITLSRNSNECSIHSRFLAAGACAELVENLRVTVEPDEMEQLYRYLRARRRGLPASHPRR